MKCCIKNCQTQCSIFQNRSVKCSIVQNWNFDNRAASTCEIKEETRFEIGIKVLLKDAAKKKQWSGKLSSKWKGPYYIHDIVGGGAYKIRTLEGKVLKASYNVKHLKRYFDQRDKLPLVFI